MGLEHMQVPLVLCLAREVFLKRHLTDAENVAMRHWIPSMYDREMKDGVFEMITKIQGKDPEAIAAMVVSTLML